MPATVAVTGASGFIGSRLTARLARQGYRVRALHHRSPLPGEIADSTAEVVRGRLEDAATARELCAGVDAVIHCAALVKARRAADFRRVNVAGVETLAGAAAEAEGQPRVLLFSSLAARRPELSPYAASKHAGERALSRSGGSRWTVLRPPAVYGPGDRELLRVFTWMQRGYALRPAPAEARFSLIHVDDLVNAALSWMEADAGYGEVLEVGDDREAGYGWTEVIETLSAALEVRPRLLAPPAAVLYTLAALSAGAAWTTRRAPMLTPAKLRELRHPDWVVRDRRARRVLGWRPGIGLDEGVRQTVSWYRGQGWL